MRKIGPPGIGVLALYVILCVFAPFPKAEAATLYVDNQNPVANDSNPGTESQPWKTIQRAASIATSGDTVIVRAGEYNEFVTLGQSGTDGSPITFSGERGADGEWLTIIDPSTSVSNGWTAAPEVGWGVYKHTNLLFSVREMTIDHKRVAFVNSMGDMASAIGQAYRTNWTTGAQLLSLPSNTAVKTALNGNTINFWDGIGALYCSTGHVCYLRLSDGGAPNGMNIRVAPNSDGGVTTDTFYPALKTQGASYVNWRNFAIRGAFACIYISGGHDVLIESNYLSGGYSRVTIASGAYHNTVRYNEVTDNYYGYNDPGAWEQGRSEPYLARENLYVTSKFLMGDSASFDYGIELTSAGSSNSIGGNHIFNGLGVGLWIVGNVSSPTRGTELYDNVIEGMPSVGILISEGHTDTRVHGNEVSDCNSNFRFHHMNFPGETSRVVYVYRNRLWLPIAVGQHMYFDAYQTVGGYLPEFWIYHNSFSGGFGALNSESVVYNVCALTNSAFIDNIFSGTEYYYSTDSRWMNTNYMGTFDYNLATPPWPAYPTTNFPSWFLANNIRQQTAVWTNAPGMDFAIKPGFLAVDAAIDVTQPFVIHGKTFPALPTENIAPTKNGWDIGAVEYRPEPPSDLHIKH